MIPKQLLLNSDGELDLEKGLRLTPDLLTYVTQKLRQRFRFFLGEWFIDQRLGIPYFEKVFISNPDVPLLATLFRKVVLGTVGVSGFKVPLVLKFDRASRTLFVTFSARLADESVVVFNQEPFVLQPKEGI